MLQIRRVSILTAAVAGLAFANGLHAAIIASDNASNSPYVAGGDVPATTEFNGQNGGTGFGAWVTTDVENPPATGATVSNGAGNGNGAAFISASNTEASNDTNSPGVFRNPAPVFDVYDNGNANSTSSTGAAIGSSIETATRPFQVSLTAGGTFAFTDTLHNLRAANAGVATSQVGFELLDSNGNTLMNLFVTGGGPGYEVNDYANPTTPLVLASTDAAHSGSSSRNLDINQTSSDTITINFLDTKTLANGDLVGDYSISVTGHRASTYADNMQFLLTPASTGIFNGGPSAFAFYDNNGGDGSDVAINNLTETAVPEPVGIALGGLACATLLRRRRR